MLLCSYLISTRHTRNIVCYTECYGNEDEFDLCIHDALYEDKTSCIIDDHEFCSSCVNNSAVGVNCSKYLAKI